MFCKNSIRVIAVVFTIFIALPIWANEFLARNLIDIDAALTEAKPGDVILLESGIWRDQVIEFFGDGAPGRPIVLRAKTPGSVKLVGSSRLEISGQWLQVEGLLFKEGALVAGQSIVQFKGRRGEAFHSRITDSAFVRYNPTDLKTRYTWVSLFGQQNRVDHNRFEGQTHAGVTIAVVRHAKREDSHRIDSNFFLDRAPGEGNGFETIRIGTSVLAGTVSNTVVELNLFERTNGEVEAVSVKSGGNLIRDNTFREVAGTITLRHGSGNTVEGNYFLGGKQGGTGGIRVSGADHIVRNNLLQEIDGLVGGAISLSCGPRIATSKIDYEPVQRLELQGNLITHINGHGIKLDAGCSVRKRSVRPNNVHVVGNYISQSNEAPLDGEAGEGWVWRANCFDSDAEVPIKLVSCNTSSLSRDSDGVWRFISSKSVLGPTNRPLNANDVGPAWWR